LVLRIGDDIPKVQGPSQNVKVIPPERARHYLQTWLPPEQIVYLGKVGFRGLSPLHEVISRKGDDPAGGSEYGHSQPGELQPNSAPTGQRQIRGLTEVITGDWILGPHETAVREGTIEFRAETCQMLGFDAFPFVLTFPRMDPDHELEVRAGFDE